MSDVDRKSVTTVTVRHHLSPITSLIPLFAAQGTLVAGILLLFVSYLFQARLHMGFYFVFLQDWFRVFPREQFHIIRTEDYSRHMLTYLKEVYRFLGLRKFTRMVITFFP